MLTRESRSRGWFLDGTNRKLKAREEWDAGGLKLQTCSTIDRPSKVCNTWHIAPNVGIVRCKTMVDCCLTEKKTLTLTHFVMSWRYENEGELKWFNIRLPTWLFFGDSGFFWQSKNTQVWLTGDFKWPAGVNVGVFFLYTWHPCVYSWGKPIRSQVCFGTTHIMSLKHPHAAAVLVVGGTSGLFNCSSLGCTLTFGAAWCGSGRLQGLVRLRVWGVSGKMASSHLFGKARVFVVVVITWRNPREQWCSHCFEISLSQIKAWVLPI